MHRVIFAGCCYGIVLCRLVAALSGARLSCRLLVLRLVRVRARERELGALAVVVRA